MNPEVKKLLTARQIQITKLIAIGFEIKEIADKLNLDHHTIEYHRTNIFYLTETKGIAQLTHFAIANEIVGLEVKPVPKKKKLTRI